MVTLESLRLYAGPSLRTDSTQTSMERRRLYAASVTAEKIRFRNLLPVVKRKNVCMEFLHAY